MSGKEDYRIFVGGLSWNATERQLENAFDRFGKIAEVQIMMERDTGRPRGFGFITFADRRGMEDAIREMHGREFGDRVISVNRAQPRMGGEDSGQGYRGGYVSSGRKGHVGGDRSAGQDDCFKCGRPGHWARDCPSAGGGRGGGGAFSSQSKFGGGRGDRFVGDRDRYVDDRYDGGRYGEGDRFDSRDSKYVTRDRYISARYQPADRFASDRFGDGPADRYPANGYDRERGYDREGGPRGGSDRYGSGGTGRGNGRNYRSRAGPYDRPSRVGQSPSFNRF